MRHTICSETSSTHLPVLYKLLSLIPILSRCDTLTQYYSNSFVVYQRTLFPYNLPSRLCLSSLFSRLESMPSFTSCFNSTYLVTPSNQLGLSFSQVALVILLVLLLLLKIQPNPLYPRFTTPLLSNLDLICFNASINIKKSVKL